MAKRLVPVSEHGIPIGEHHHRATIPDAVILRVRELREEHRLTVPAIARRMALSYETTRSIVYHRRRCSAPRGWNATEHPPTERMSPMKALAALAHRFGSVSVHYAPTPDGRAGFVLSSGDLTEGFTVADLPPHKHGECAAILAELNAQILAMHEKAVATAPTSDD